MQEVGAYLVYCRVEGRTAKTLQWHTTALDKLSRYLEECGITDVGDVTREHLRAYVAHLQQSEGRDGAPMSPHSVATYVRSFRAFFRWLVDEEYIGVNPAAKVREPRAGESVKETLTPAQVRAIVAACVNARDRAIALTLYDSGIRASELTTALRESFSDSPPSLRVLGKGRRYRVVPLGRSSSRAIRRYLRERTDASPYLFVARGGDKLTPNGLGLLLTRLARSAGVPKCNPHMWRHTMAVTYLRAGGDVLSLQRILGHSTLEVTRIYAQLADEDVLKAHSLYSPGDML